VLKPFHRHTYVCLSLKRLILMDKCKKGSGLHWDVVLLSILNVPGALFGGPWICAATVRAIAHCSALTVMSTTHAPGESPKVVEVRGKSGLPLSRLLGISFLTLGIQINGLQPSLYLYLSDWQSFCLLCSGWYPMVSSLGCSSTWVYHL